MAKNLKQSCPLLEYKQLLSSTRCSYVYLSKKEAIVHLQLSQNKVCPLVKKLQRAKRDFKTVVVVIRFTSSQQIPFRKPRLKKLNEEQHGLSHICVPYLKLPHIFFFLIHVWCREFSKTAPHTTTPAFLKWDYIELWLHARVPSLHKDFAFHRATWGCCVSSKKSNFSKMHNWKMIILKS